MWESAIVAYLHYLSFGVVLASLIVERQTIKSELNIRESWVILFADGIYGTAATLLLATGVLRLLYFGKGTEFYTDNPVFWAKVILFFAVASISLYPTISYLLWIGNLRQNLPPKLNPFRANLIKWIINIELVGFSSIPLLASMMARGIGLE
ncbi:MAG: DUF2214 family protein [Halothece sp.]